MRCGRCGKRTLFAGLHLFTDRLCLLYRLRVAEADARDLEAALTGLVELRSKPRNMSKWDYADLKAAAWRRAQNALRIYQDGRR